ncbi:TPA: hypothetical protein TZN99_001318 [Streptococcus suis]|nr:hypothetical protein [Streptococcus suis]
MEADELFNHFNNIIMSYERKLVGPNLNTQGAMIEELIQLVKKEFFRFVPDNSQTGEEWLTIERVFFSLLLGVVEDKNYTELNSKLEKFSYTVVEVISEFS